MSFSFSYFTINIEGGDRFDLQMSTVLEGEAKDFSFIVAQFNYLD